MQDEHALEQMLAQRAIENRKKAYVPYSHYRVGACLRDENGNLFDGCNVEGASYGVTICAERTALVKAISEGSLKFTHIAVAGSGDDDPAWPCGICRQLLYEFAPELTVIVALPDGRTQVKKLYELLPHAFGPSSLPTNLA